MIDIDALRQAISYCPETGALTWANVRPGKRCNGDPAGCIDKLNGYVRLRFQRKMLLGHRVAFAIVTGRWPKLVDHINGNRSDNRWANLREADQSANHENRRVAASHSTTGLLGVQRSGNRYMARLTVKGKRLYFGCHATPEQAHAAYLVAKREHHAGATI